MKTQYSLEMTKVCVQCEKKVVFDITGVEDFAIALVNSLLNLPDRQVKFLGEWNQRLFITVKYNHHSTVLSAKTTVQAMTK